jgi:Acetyl xylan esterase (AXE1)
MTDRAMGTGVIRGAVVTAIAAGFALLAARANAEIPQVFTAAPGSTPVNCTVQGPGPDEGVRFCTDGLEDPDPRSTVKTFDGVPLDVNVAFPPEPLEGPDGSYPMVMMFHGYGGSKLGLGSMRRWLSQGYATFSVTTRGFHESCGNAASRAADPTGCAEGWIRLMDTRYEVRDAQYLAGLLVDEGLVDPARIGAIGGSYGGGMSMSLAALRDRVMMPNGRLVDWQSPNGTPMRIAAAAPGIPWTDLAQALTPNGSVLDYVANAPYLGASGRIGVEKKAWVDALYLGGQLTGFYAPPGADPDADLTTWKQRLDQGGPYDGDPQAEDVVDEVTTHHSSYYIDHSQPPAPLIISNGFTDDLFPANEALRFYNRTRTQYPNAPIALTFGDFGHARGANKADIGALVAQRENTWFAHYLKGEGEAPPSDVVAMTQTCPSSAPSGGPFTAPSWAEIAPGEIRFRREPAERVAPSGTQYGPELGDWLGTPGAANPCTQTPAADNPATANYRLPPAPAGGYTMLGSPTVIAGIALTGANSQLAARLFDVAPNGQQTLVARGLWRPEVSGKRAVRQVFQLTPNGWQFAEGHVPKLELLPDDAPYGLASPGQRPVRVSNLELRLPVVEEPGSLGGLVKAPAPKVLPRGYRLARGFDAGPPSTRIDAAPPKRTRKRSVTFRFSASDVGSSFECKLDGRAFTRCASPKRYGKVSRGSHSFQVRAIDPDGNRDSSPAKHRFRVVGRR